MKSKYLASSTEVLSLIKIHEALKSEAKAEIAKLKKLGLKVVMATGDHKKTGVLYPFFGFLLSPAIAGALMAFESITVVMNSLRLRNTKL